MVQKDPENNIDLDHGIGRVSRMWGHVELAFYIIFSELAELSAENAFVISASLDYRHLRDLIESFAAIKIKDKAVASRLTAFLSAVKGMNIERNNAIHALWVNHPGSGKTTRIKMRNKGSYKMDIETVAAKHLIIVSEKIAKLSNDGVAIASDVRACVKAWRETNPPIDWPFEELA